MLVHVILGLHHRRFVAPQSVLARSSLPINMLSQCSPALPPILTHDAPGELQVEVVHVLVVLPIRVEEYSIKRP